MLNCLICCPLNFDPDLHYLYLQIKICHDRLRMRLTIILYNGVHDTTLYDKVRQ
jgi:hypothetical protein